MQGGSFQADISPAIVAGTPLVRSYGDDYFQLPDQRCHTGIMIHATTLIAPWGPASPSKLTLQDVQPVLDDAPEVFILGTGRRIVFPEQDFVDAFHQAGIGFEFMESRAAARTYNIIAGEGRIISACFFLPGCC